MTLHSAPNRRASPAELTAEHCGPGCSCHGIHPSEEVVLGCTRCPYQLAAHIDGRCPTEAEAVAAWGRS